MNDTPPDGGTATTDDPSDDFKSERLRSVTDMQRSSQDRLVAGVCAGLGRYLNVDPVVVRVITAVLTLVGGAGIILYVAAWFLIPSDDADQSVAADWFNLDENEERVRVGGMVIAAVLALLSVVGDAGWGWGGGFPWWLIFPALLVYVFVVRPNRRRRGTTGTDTTRDIGTWADDVAARSEELGDRAQQATTSALERSRQRRREARAQRSNVLFALTLSIIAIAMAVTRLVSEANGGTAWTTYLVVALTIIGLALLISSLWGHGRPLIPLGILLTLVLAVGTALPSARLGQQTVDPTSAAELESSYTHGIGELDIDLTQVKDPKALLGRTLDVDAGIGHTRITVPDGLNVRVRTDLEVGDLRVLGRSTSGSDLELNDPGDSGPALTIDVDQTIGQIEVISQ